MKPEIVIQEQAGLTRTNEYVRLGVPWARGQLHRDSSVRLQNSAGETLPCQTKSLKNWPDGSIKWLLTDFPVSLPAGATGHYQLMADDKPPLVITTRIQVHEGFDHWQIDTGVGKFIIDAKIFRPFTQVYRQEEPLLLEEGGSFILTLDGLTFLTPIIDCIEAEAAGPLRAIIRITGHCDLAQRKKVRFICRLHFFAASLASQIEFTLHNPHRACHSGGLWDLGDPNSFLFKELAFAFKPIDRAAARLHCTIEPQTAPLNLPATSSYTIYQESSGGPCWQSANHRNRHGLVPMQRQGYCVELQGKVAQEGRRASPSLWWGDQGIGIAVAMANFWQEFPKSISFAANEIRLALFPGRFPDLHELQGGEQKTHSLFVDFAAAPEAMAARLTPLQAVIHPKSYHESAIIGDLPEPHDLFDQFSSATALLAKRELVDEYGWRNFGDIYADHEAVFAKSNQQFVSHYNNQYDCCAGAYRKFFATGDPAWAILAADLARHIIDIDLYHTDEDREEYNHGLFWHTDHYLDAGLSSHRSFSKEHLQTKSPALYGGGPGPEHCYTTGLMLHYFQTGNPIIKQAVIDLAKWELKALAGSKTVLAAIQRGLSALQAWRVSRGTRRLFPRYPLSRGTGNALIACLDAFELGGDRNFLDKAGQLIRGALHPHDDLQARNLLDAERSWSYTVLLVAIAKYLDKKTELNDFDYDFNHARASLLVYAEWMVVHEYPYLDKPEILEFPNETWDAQDLRKSVIFFHAARYSETAEQLASFQEKARFFFTKAGSRLANHPTSKLTRPLVLILQNSWVGKHLAENIPQAARGPITTTFGKPTPRLCLTAIITRICSDLINAITHVSLTKEIAWLRFRL